MLVTFVGDGLWCFKNTSNNPLTWFVSLVPRDHGESEIFIHLVFRSSWAGVRLPQLAVGTTYSGWPGRARRAKPVDDTSPWPCLDISPPLEFQESLEGLGSFLILAEAIPQRHLSVPRGDFSCYRSGLITEIQCQALLHPQPAHSPEVSVLCGYRLYFIFCIHLSN